MTRLRPAIQIPRKQHEAARYLVFHHEDADTLATILTNAIVVSERAGVLSVDGADLHVGVEYLQLGVDDIPDKGHMPGDVLDQLQPTDEENGP